MSQSLSQLYVHMVFHIKKNSPIIQSKNSNELYAYINGIIKNMDCTPIALNGTPDHIHILCGLSKNISLSKAIQEIKRSSSRWLKLLNNNYRNFEWQAGYGAFSVSSSVLGKTERYINDQREHHKKIDFRKEYILLLEKYDIQYDEKYLWED